MAALILDFGFRFENYCGGCRVNGVGYGVLGVGCGVWGVGCWRETLLGNIKKMFWALGAGGCEFVYKMYGRKDRTDDWAGY